MSPTLGAIDPQTLRLGAAIRAARLTKALTLVELAHLSSLSHPFLSQLERGHARPSMASLERIARALETSQLDLLAAAAPDAVPGSASVPAVSTALARGRVVRADGGTRGPYAEGEGRLLVDRRAKFQPMEFVGANGAFGDYYHHTEDEFVTVITGRVVVDLAGDREFLLDQGDSLYYEGGTPHRWRSHDEHAYRLLIVKQRL